MTIYRDFDREALDVAYNNSAAVPDAEAVIARWVSAGDAMAEAPGAFISLGLLLGIMNACSKTSQS